jgi:palmitoyltransferase ZDHHC2/15/20
VAAVLVLLALAPHPSLLIMLVNYHLNTLHSPLQFGIHLLVTYTLTFCAFSSIIVCVARDPGPVEDTRQDDDGGMDLTQALMASDHEDDLSAPGKFCRKCWAPKPERAHHCSICGRCVLKMGSSVRWTRYHAIDMCHRSSLRMVSVEMHRELCFRL